MSSKSALRRVNAADSPYTQPYQAHGNLISRIDMQAARHSTVNEVVEAARLSSEPLWAPFTSVHDLLYDSGEPSKESVVYARHGAALGKRTVR